MATRIHLVAIDLDGTLLNSAKEITDTTSTILRTVRETRGVHVVLATARPPRSVLPFHELLDLDTPMINYNGALVFDPTCSRVIMHRPIAPKTARRVVDVARGVYPGVLVSGEILDRLHTDRFDAAYATETDKLGLAQPDVSPVDRWMTEAITKLLLLGEPDPLMDAALAVRRALRHQVTLMRTEPTLIQVTHPTVSKAAALKTVAGELGIPREQVMAIGDNANDVTMLEWAGIGVAMENAAPEAIAAADMVTDHHDADGAAKAIHRVIVQGLHPDPRRA